MVEIRVNNQEELEAALKAGKLPICVGNGYFTASGSATVTASGSATVTASGSATVRAYGSATVTASGFATVRAYGSATVRASGFATVRAYGSATVRASGSATVRATPYVPVILPAAHRCNVTGGRVLEFPALDTVEKWCDFYGLSIVDGVVVLYKGVDDNFKSPRGADYSPGNSPVADDWDGGKQECGQGLHFSPNAMMTLRFFPTATKFCGCPVNVSELSVHPNGEYPEKVKARGCGSCFEVTIDGDRIIAVEAVDGSEN